MKNPNKVKIGKKNRASGADFERRVRKDLEEKGWIVDKWSNNVEFGDISGYDYLNKSGKESADRQILLTGKLIPAKRKYAGPGRPLAIGTGFCDFIAFKKPEIDSIGHYNQSFNNGDNDIDDMYEIIGIECKTNGYLDKIEKQKCKWYIDNKIFSKILIASKHKIKNRIHIEYKEFK